MADIKPEEVKTEVVKRVPEFVKKEDFDKSMGMIMSSIETLAKAISVKKEQEALVAPVKKVKVEGTPDYEAPIPPQWREIVDELLGEDVGTQISYPDNGGFKFTLIIPQEKSNAGDEWWKTYKHDHRTKMLNPSEGISGVRKYCELVKQNLNTKK